MLSTLSLLLVLTWSGLPEPVFDPASPLTVEQAMALARAVSPAARVLRAREQVALADRRLGIVLQNPRVSLETRSPSPERPYELSVHQDVLDVLSLPARRAAADRELQAARLGIEHELLSLELEARAAHLRLLAAQESLALLRQVEEAERAALELWTRGVEAGNVALSDLDLEAAEADRIALDRLTAEAELRAAQSALAARIGHPGQAGSLVAAGDLGTIVGAPPQSGAGRRRLDIEARASEVEAAARAVRAARWHRLPELGIGFHYEREPDGESSVGPDLELSLPIFNRGGAGVARARAEELARRAAEAELRAQAEAERIQAQSALDAASRRVTMLEQTSLPRARRIVESAELEYNAMHIGAAEFVRRKRAELELRREHLAALEALGLARIEWERAHGAVDRTGGQR